MLAFVYLTLVSTITGVMGAVILWRRISLFTGGTRAVGRFVRWEGRGVRTTYYHPVVRFAAHDGKQYEFVAGPGITKKKEKTIYRVIYPAEAPDKAMALSFWGFWAAPPAFFILSAGAAVAAFQQKSG